MPQRRVARCKKLNKAVGVLREGDFLRDEFWRRSERSPPPRRVAVIDDPLARRALACMPERRGCIRGYIPRKDLHATINISYRPREVWVDRPAKTRPDQVRVRHSLAPTSIGSH